MPTPLQTLIGSSSSLGRAAMASSHGWNVKTQTYNAREQFSPSSDDCGGLDWIPDEGKVLYLIYSDEEVKPSMMCIALKCYQQSI